MSMYNLLEYSGNYPKTSDRLHQYCRDEPVLDKTGVIVDLTYGNNTDSFKSK